MKPFYVLLILLWFKTKLIVYQSINLTGITISTQSINIFYNNQTNF
jgi:hypothetical protein